MHYINPTWRRSLDAGSQSKLSVLIPSLATQTINCMSSCHLVRIVNPIHDERGILMSLWLRRRDLRTHLYIAAVIKPLATYVYIFLLFFLIFLLHFITITINLIQLLAEILIRINYLSPALPPTTLVHCCSFWFWSACTACSGQTQSVCRLSVSLALRCFSLWWFLSFM